MDLCKGEGQGTGRYFSFWLEQRRKERLENGCSRRSRGKGQKLDPSGLNKEKKVQEGNEDVEKLQEKEQKRSMEKERNHKKNREGKQQKE
ncbi:MAG: hypothetical protein QNL11_07930 [Desulfobacterales bacterium]|nr:hypothetical protein [Desulfobacterales bacterium]